MSNLEVDPDEVIAAADTAEPDPRCAVELLDAREVPLGGIRAMTVRRTLPQRQRTLIGAWCFVDHYGPDDVAATGGMDVAPHPHTGLQTVSWLFSGEIEHRDSTGVQALVRPGELNLMTAGSGIAHSEVTTSATSVLHGVQLWVALPDDARHMPATFEHYAPPTTSLGNASARVFMGTLAGETSPVRTHTPLLGAELVLEPGAVVPLEADPSFEYGVLVDRGPVLLQDTTLHMGQLGYVGLGVSTLQLTNRGQESARVMLLGGTPFGEEILMWWNFVGRSHHEIVAYREQYEAEISGGREPEQFGLVVGYPGAALHAPPMPAVQLRPRKNPPN
ncbi:hypothetical protein CLV47_11260 [Antricoccus suffuscus]|uniref:Pirin n=1 Tax=Antricoccus suffuscus TaxID=1629062 RepID=A0A2T0ZXQ5_9ACTN|nr:pirin family protein [Antricoccus suffuscus]PRZ41027.1 hypothetical protein CLV47_11260 [Antricoccus suffuscus]